MIKNVHGSDGFIWAIGVVESRKDPLLLGRCKVRYLHHHTENKSDLQTEDLPWSYPLVPLDPGTNVVGPKEGDWVVAFFRDGPLAQEPVMMGILPGIPEDPANPEIGFNDPRPDSILEGHQVPRDPEPPTQTDTGEGTFWDERSPKSRFPEERYLKESTFDRTGRDENISETIVQQKRDNRAIGQIAIPTAAHTAGTGSDADSPGGDFSEPDIPYGTEYPYNHLYYSEGGHLKEIDDTPGKERLHEYHRVGTFTEVHPDGSRVKKVVNDDTEIVLRKKFIHVEAFKEETIDWYYKIYVNKDGEAGFNYDLTVGPGGNINLTTEDGNFNVKIAGDANIYVEKKATIEVEEDLIATVHRDAHIKVDENLRATIDGDADLFVGGHANIEVEGDLHSVVGGDEVSIVNGDKFEHIKGDYYTLVGGKKQEFVAGDIERISGRNIDDVALITHNSMAGVSISDTSPLTFRTGAIHNFTGVIEGIATGIEGVPGPVPTIEPANVLTAITGLVKSIEAEKLSILNPLDIFLDYTDLLNVVVEIAIEDSQSEAEANPNSPTAQSAASSSSGGSGGGGGGGSKGGEPIYGVDPGFLWKPISESNGNLVVLLPRGTKSGDVVLKGPDGNDIGVGKFSGVHNGGREHYRFEAPGGSFPPNTSVNFNGQKVTIPNTGTRYEGAGKEPPPVVETPPTE